MYVLNKQLDQKLFGGNFGLFTLDIFYWAVFY